MWVIFRSVVLTVKQRSPTPYFWVRILADLLELCFVSSRFNGVFNLITGILVETKTGVHAALRTYGRYISSKKENVVLMNLSGQ